MMNEMEDEADRVRAQIEAALLDTTFSPSSALGQISPPDNEGLDFWRPMHREHAR